MSAFTAKQGAIFTQLLAEFGEDLEVTLVSGPPAIECKALRVDDDEVFSPGVGGIQAYAVTYEFLRSEVPTAFTGAVVVDTSRGGTFRIEGQLSRTNSSVKYAVSQVSQ